jgi:hypothetical protein
VERRNPSEAYPSDPQAVSGALRSNTEPEGDDLGYETVRTIGGVL